MENLTIAARFISQPQTGVQRYARNTIKNLGIPYDLISNGSQDEDKELGEIRNFCRPFNGHFWEQICLPIYLRKGRPLWSPSGIGPVLHNNNVLTITDIASMTNPEWYSRSYSLWYNNVLPRAAKNAKAVITISEFSARDIADKFGISRDRIFVTYLAADDLHDPTQLERQYSILDTMPCLQKPYVLAVGGFSRRKNLKTIIDLWEEDNILSSSHNLIVVGENQKIYNSAITSTDHKDSVYFTGRVNDDDLARLYRGARLLIYPSLFEGFGLPIVEAMRFSCPVAASNVTSIPEVGGSACQYFNPNDRNDIRRTVQRILSEPELAADMVQAGLEREATFSWSRTGAQTAEVLKNVFRL